MSAAPSIICLPPAGAGPSLYRPWQRLDPGVIAPAIPGREGRFREAAPDSLGSLADRIAAEIAPSLPRRYGLFGYSMGGTLAFLIAERLATMGLPGPEALFVLGAPPPDRLEEETAGFHAMDSAAFWTEIARLGGTPPEIIADAEMRALFEPALRQDFRICETYHHPPTGFRLKCSVHVITGDEDHLAKPEYGPRWGNFTTGPVTQHAIAGGHMLPPDAFAALIARIRRLWPVKVPG